MREDDQHLLVAKVLVISRLIHKPLSLSSNKPPIVDQLWEKLLSARRKLLRRIDKRLASTAGDTTGLVESMCAYALATSSTPSDVLKHFHKVRKEKMVSELRKGGGELAKRGINALRLCIQTCQDTQTIFPRRLAEALAKLKAYPLVQDPEVRALHELNLDIHDRWIGAEVRNYTPWPRHDELQRPEAEKILHRWSKDTISAFLKEVKTSLLNEDRLIEVASLRQELIETWMLSGPRMTGVKFANVLDDLRDTMNEKLEAIVRARTQDLQGVVGELTAGLDSLKGNNDLSSLSLWNNASDGKDLSNGAHAFKSAIINTHQGRDRTVLDVTTAFDNWMDSVLEVKGIVKSMKETRWDDTFADDIEEGSNDDDLGDSKQTLLSADDPQLLEDVTQEAISQSLQSMGKSLSQIAQTATDDKGDGSVQNAMFILRVIRDFGDRLQRLRLQERSSAFPTPFTSDVLQPLHTTLAMHVAQLTLSPYVSTLRSSIKGRTQTHILWEGHPALPSQPSSSAFRFLREVNCTMARLGSDLWTPSAVVVVKKQMSADIAQVLEKHIDAIRDAGPQEEIKADALDEAKTDGQERSDESNAVIAMTPTQSQDALTGQRFKQLAFDALYIQRFFSDNSKSLQTMDELIRKIDLEDVDDAAMQRLRKNAADYAKKTYLLFALLA